MKRRALLGVLSLLVVTVSTSASRGWALGSYAGKVELLSVDVARHLTKRARLKGQFHRLVLREAGQLHLRSNVVLSASLLELDTRREADLLETRCVVSVVVHAQATGAIRAILRGRGSVRTQPDDREGEAIALEAATAGALQRVPAAVDD